LAGVRDRHKENLDATETRFSFWTDENPTIARALIVGQEDHGGEALEQHPPPPDTGSVKKGQPFNIELSLAVERTHTFGLIYEPDTRVSISGMDAPKAEAERDRLGIPRHSIIKDLNWRASRSTTKSVHSQTTALG